MQISSLTDQAVILMQAAAGRCGGTRPSATDLAEATGIAVPTAQKLVSVLSRAGLLRSTRGLGGGVRLARPAASITLAEVVEALEGPIALTSCLDERRHDRCAREARCGMRPHWAPVNAAIRDVLAGVTLASLFAPVDVEAAA